MLLVTSCTIELKIIESYDCLANIVNFFLKDTKCFKQIINCIRFSK